MKSTENKLNQMLEELLNKFFRAEDISEILSQIRTRIQLPEEKAKPLKPTDKEQIEYEVSHDSSFRALTDFLITLAENKFEQEVFMDFMLELGQLAITFGELNIAADIEEKILRDTENEKSLQRYSAEAYLALGSINRRQAQWRISIDCYEKADKIFRKLKDKRGTAKCENQLGNLYGEQGNTEEAKKHFKKSLSFLDPEADIAMTATLEVNLGIISNIQGETEEAFDYYTQSLSKFEKLNDVRRVAEVRHNIGMLYLKKNDYEMAVQELDNSISSSMKAGNVPFIGLSYLSKAYVYAQLRDHLLAVAYADKAMEICNKTNDKLSVAEIYKVKGIINKNLGNHTLSESYFLTSLRINRDLKNSLNYAETCYEMGLLYKERSMPKEAGARLGEALEYYRSIDSKRDVEKIEELLRE